MKMIFYWFNEWGSLAPQADSDVKNEDGISLISCLLMDDGGLPYDSVLAFIREGVLRANKVLNGEIDSCRWDREVWGALLSHDNVIVSSFLNEGYEQILNTQSFRQILIAWEHFFQSTPDIDQRIEMLI